MPRVGPGQFSYEFAVKQSALWGDMFGSLPDPDLVIRKLGRSKAAVFKELRTDPDISAAIGVRKAGTKRKIWDVDRDNHRGEQTDLIVQVLNDLKMNRVISEILDTPLYGFTVFEHTWDWRGKYYVPVKLEAKPNEWFSYSTDNVLQFTPDQGSKKDVPRNKFLNPQHEPSYNNPYGLALLSPCFWPYTFKRGGMKLAVRYTEKYGMPWAVAKYPRGWTSEKIQELINLIEDTVQDGVLAIPDGTEAALVNAGNRGNVDIFNLLIDGSNDTISKVICGHTGALNSTPGKLGSEDNALSARDDLTDSDTELVVDTVQELVDLICEVNFSERSEFHLVDKERVDRQLAERDKILSETGVAFRKIYHIRRHGLKEDEFDIVPKDPTPAAPNAGDFNEDDTPPSDFDERFSQFEQFAKGNITVPDDQSFVDDLEDPPAAQLNYQAEQITRPLLDLLSKAKNFKQAMAIVRKAYPEMDSSDLVSVIRKSIFFAEVAGRLGADAEDSE